MTARTLPGGVVAVPGPVAAELIELPGFHALRVRSRGTPGYAPLRALYELGLRNTVPHNGTTNPFAAAAIPHWITTDQAADLLGITDRAVRKRIANQQLEAERRGRRWQVSRHHVERLVRARRDVT